MATANRVQILDRLFGLHGVKLKENEKLAKYQDFAREMENVELEDDSDSRSSWNNLEEYEETGGRLEY